MNFPRRSPFSVPLCVLCISVVNFFSCSSEKPREKVDLIVHNAVVYTVDSLFSVAESFAIKDGKIIAVGKSDSILAQYDGEKLDAQGKAVYPGFIDSHCHFLGYGLGLNQADLVGTKSFDEVLKKVVEFAEVNKSEWIIGRGWDQNDWDVKEFPDRKKLDSLFPNTPVFLKRIDGHAVLVNGEALRRAKITNRTKVTGGTIEYVFTNDDSWTVEEDRKEIKRMSYPYFDPTGILIDNAIDLVASVIPPPTPAQMENALLKAQKNCFEVGLTTVDDAGLMKHEIDAIDSLQKQGKLKMRVYAMLSDSAPNYAHYLVKNVYKTERLNVRSFKLYADGALGSRGACLMEDYHDKKGWSGFLLNKLAHFEKRALQLYEQGFQMNVHCIGDSAHRAMLNVYRNTVLFPRKKLNGSDTIISLRTHDPGPKYWRWRIEHAQVIHPSDLDIYKTCGIIPSVQPTHATSDMYWAEERLGKERMKGAYAYRSLLKAAGMVALGTDFPVEQINPMTTFYAAVFRKDAKGFPEGGFMSEEALTREETLKGMTIWGAFANFEEKEKGSIEPGKFADFVILDNDIMKCEESKILSTKVLYTFLNGEKVYGSGSL
ncbi:MAG: amidohydrolase [Bacteroidota bacterium]